MLNRLDAAGELLAQPALSADLCGGGRIGVTSLKLSLSISDSSTCWQPSRL
jgi:hypothetical protein